jgi:hypothetical protein
MRRVARARCRVSINASNDPRVDRHGEGRVRSILRSLGRLETPRVLPIRKPRLHRRLRTSVPLLPLPSIRDDDDRRRIPEHEIYGKLAPWTFRGNRRWRGGCGGITSSNALRRMIS